MMEIKNFVDKSSSPSLISIPELGKSELEKAVFPFELELFSISKLKKILANYLLFLVPGSENNVQ